jgi:hypothetical protein
LDYNQIVEQNKEADKSEYLARKEKPVEPKEEKQEFIPERFGGLKPFEFHGKNKATEEDDFIRKYYDIKGEPKKQPRPESGIYAKDIYGLPRYNEGGNNYVPQAREEKNKSEEKKVVKSSNDNVRPYKVVNNKEPRKYFCNEKL